LCALRRTFAEVPATGQVGLVLPLDRPHPHSFPPPAAARETASLSQPACRSPRVCRSRRSGLRYLPFFSPWDRRFDRSAVKSCAADLSLCLPQNLVHSHKALLVHRFPDKQTYQSRLAPFLYSYLRSRARLYAFEKALERRQCRVSFCIRINLQGSLV